MGQAEAPARLVIGRHIRNGVRLIRNREEMRLELVESEPCVDRRGISDDVQIALREVDDAAPMRIFEDRPSVISHSGRHGPVESLASRLPPGVSATAAASARGRQGFGGRPLR